MCCGNHSKIDKLVPNGDYVRVQGHNLHVFRTGNERGPQIIVMSGSGVPAPVYDYKVLYNKLSKDFHIIVIEKFGYGYSDLYECSCEIDSLLSYQREALKKLGEKGPYILLPHSMSGLEAIRWKQKYPDEVKAIIGMDMAMPAEYMKWTPNDLKLRMAAMKMVPLLKKMGLLAFYPINTRELSAEEIKQEKLLIKRNLMGINIMNEGAALLDNAVKVASSGSITCPMLLFVSNGKQVSRTWVDSQREFSEQMNAETVYFSCGHCIHYYESDAVSKKTMDFLGKLE